MSDPTEPQAPQPAAPGEPAQPAFEYATPPVPEYAPQVPPEAYAPQGDQVYGYQQPPQQPYQSQYPPQQQYQQSSQQAYQQPYQQQPYQQGPGDVKTSDKDRVVAGILGILLGSLGIHKFYLGYRNEGLIMILVTIIGGCITLGIAAAVMGVIGLIEGIMYLTKSQQEFEQTYVYNRKPWF